MLRGSGFESATNHRGLGDTTSEIPGEDHDLANSPIGEVRARSDPLNPGLDDRRSDRTPPRAPAYPISITADPAPSGAEGPPVESDPAARMASPPTDCLWPTSGPRWPRAATPPAMWADQSRLLGALPRAPPLGPEPSIAGEARVFRSRSRAIPVLTLSGGKRILRPLEYPPGMVSTERLTSRVDTRIEPPDSLPSGLRAQFLADFLDDPVRNTHRATSRRSEMIMDTNRHRGRIGSRP